MHLALDQIVFSKLEFFSC